MLDAVPDLAPDAPATMTRRVAMAGGLVAMAGVAAACAVGGSDPIATPGGAGGSGTRGPDGSGAATGSSGGLVALADVPVGGAVAVTIEGAPAVVARPDDQTVTAFSARCTHMGCTVLVAGATLQCPCHGSQYDALTGAVLRGPATEDLPAIEVHLDGADVVAG